MNVRIQPDTGTDFVGYRIEELIGRGGMGVVYRAYDLRLKRTVALKLVAPELVLEDTFRARFERETELAMALEHPNVVPIYDAGDVDGRLYLAMRLVEGSDLRAVLRAEGTLSPVRAFAICRQVGAALDAAHAKGLIHRDVKPSNVLVDPDDHVYVADLGLSRRLEEQPGPVSGDRSLGTPAYLAPEQIEGGPIDGRADVYALGCLFHECLTGQPPFTRDSRLALAWAHLEEEPVPASTHRAGLPPEIDGVLAKALAKLPSDRYSSCAGFMGEAQQALGFGSPSGVRRRPLVLLAAAVLIALAAAMISFAALRHRGTSAPPAVRPNTLVRIDPKRDAIREVIATGLTPIATAAAGRFVWVYNHGSGSVAEVDAVRGSVLRKVRLDHPPIYVSLPNGPVLGADKNGAWVIGSAEGSGALTNVRAGMPGKRVFRLDVDPLGVAVGEGAVWVVGERGFRSQLRRIDPETGRVTGRAQYRRGIALTSLTVGLGFVWAVDATHGTLYRIDRRTLAITGRRHVGHYPARPKVRYGDVWVAVTDPGAHTVVVAPTMQETQILDCCPPNEGSSATGFGSTWVISWPTGVVVRFDAVTKQTVSTIHVTDSPLWGAPCMTSITVAGDSVWVTVARSAGGTCTV